MTIESWPVTDRASWLARRELDVTASVAGCLLGVHEFQTPFGLWALKTGRISEDPEESPPMKRGRLLEPVAVQMLRELRPTWRIEQPGIYLRDPAVRLGATPDCYAYDPERAGRGVIQIKTVEPGVFRRKWRNPDTDEIECPLWIAVQAIVEAHLAGAQWAEVAAMTVSFGCDIHPVPVPIHPGVIAKVEAAVADFWKMVEEGREPKPDYARDGEIIAGLYEEDRGTEIDLSMDNQIPELVERRAGLKQIIKDAEAGVAAIDNEVKAKIGENAVALIRDGKRITWKTQNRAGFYVEPKAFRVLRYPQAKKEAEL